ncbi:hypothetical protein CEXT_335271 [Caerostris extrusa]|uniref:Uncharacterized protein n=1 Tax=Caerostris extrusa TaxID=172846 RepID=A0AAV4T3W2_CAEEX|nr:hypothetical protein CEXT_335271 [Caerostris extrusa]
MQLGNWANSSRRTSFQQSKASFVWFHQTFLISFHISMHFRHPSEPLMRFHINGPCRPLSSPTLINESICGNFAQQQTPTVLKSEYKCI